MEQREMAVEGSSLKHIFFSWRLGCVMLNVEEPQRMLLL